ncbi:MAG: hypothetical protein ACKVU1_06405 [bacterium]
MLRHVARIANILCAALVIAGAASNARAEEKMNAAIAEAPSPAAAQFDRIKSLAGTWTGTAGFGDGEDSPTEITYRVTAGGSTVIETLFGGSEHEMITMYHMNGGELMLTHYCATGNQPRMRLVPNADPNTLVFDFLDASNMKSADQHMHSAKITFVDADHVRSSWTSYADGKPAGDAKFDIARKK